MIDLARRQELFNQGYWEVPDNLDTSNFDFSWRPEPYDRPYIHQFGTQWQKTGGPRFVIPENEGIKYQSHQHAIRLRDESSRAWRPLEPNVSFDYSWHPDDTDPPYIYIFGNQWYDSETMPTIQYRVKGATEKKFIQDVRARLDPCMDSRAWRPLVPNATIDFSWVPHPNDPPYIYVFGNQWYDVDIMPTYQYRVKGATEKKYMTDVRATLLPDMSKWKVPDDIEDTFDYSWVPHPHEPKLNWQFGTQHQKNGGPKYITDESLGTKYTDVQRAIKKSNKEKRNWRLLLPNVDFDWSWHPDEDEPPYNYVFGNQWYDYELMPTLVYRVSGASEKKYMDITATLLPDKTRWVIPDYITDFDYSWLPHPHDPPHEHQFPTEWHYTAGPKYVCENSKGVKYHSELVAKTNVTDVKDMVDIVEYADSVIDVLRKHKFKRPFVYIKRKDSNVNLTEIFKSSDSLVHVIDGSEVLASEIAIDYIFDKIYDYPKISYHTTDYEPELLDIVFFSNGESCAEENYQRLLDLKLPNRIVHIKDVQGRVASQHAAANASNTEWYFLVNAKLRVNSEFDFRWQPDVLKSRRHYIFRASNPVNGLEYGHMAIVANNKTLTLNTKGRGLDFTLDSPTEVVDINSGIAVYNSSPWDTWRTAFREVIKLCYAKDSESKKRLEVWASIADGEFAQYSLKGANDAVNYFKLVNGDFEKLKLSYDWAWLKEQFNK